MDRASTAVGAAMDLPIMHDSDRYDFVWLASSSSSSENNNGVSSSSSSSSAEKPPPPPHEELLGEIVELPNIEGRFELDSDAAAAESQNELIPVDDDFLLDGWMINYPVQDFFARFYEQNLGPESSIPSHFEAYSLWLAS